MNLFRQLVQTAGIAGGSEESNNEIIESAKSYYCYVIQSIIRDINGQIAKSSILQQTNELLEEEGGIEEFDSLENLYEDWKFISLS
ncbi:MAG: hypothetical protein EZS28_037027 [Streblomastix strix]|uniref:Uncharacterized protein n=1 Tax=Streblomastix strix TaxID=222440 RepID=A0A5J4U967_9EUKA|nr:MAG: hypothetical protein EZS28_037027 [Streblomastix strix]